MVYRASSTQKAELMTFIKKYDKKRTCLAIGDGANDVKMIQTANIGVGIVGKDSTIASAHADFSISQFKHLRRLLFFHGSSYGHSLTNYIVCEITRMTLFGFTVFFYSFMNGFSGTHFIQNFLMIYYACSSYGFYSVIENNVNNLDHEEGETEISITENYKHCRNGQGEKMLRKFAIFSGFAYVGGAIATFIPFYALRDAVDDTGKTLSIWQQGFAVQTCLMLYTNILFCTYIRDWNLAMIAGVAVVFTMTFMMFILC